MVNFLLTLVFGLLLVGGCSARVVTVSPGPLVRVEGQPVSIRCNVTEYGGPREQDFNWEMSKDATGAKIRIISTFDTNFPDPSLSKRVASGDISVGRLKDNEAEMKIAELKSQDAGFYFCQTPSTDSVISGNYVAQVQLTVIPNTLKVSPETPPQVIPEGSDLTLSCNVTRKLTYPTYLSVTWSVKKGATSEEILTFGPQGEVVTGSGYARRYADGGIRLVPGRNGVFELVITRATTSDDGIYECNGTEWTHESGGKWTKIVESKKEMGTVAVTPTGRSLNVRASSFSSPSSTSLLLSPGDSLTLLCSVFADNLPALTLEVTWLADGQEIITMEHSGVVISNTTSSAVPTKRVEANLERTNVGEYKLGVRGVRGEDAGVYTCRIRAYVEKGGRSAGGGGRWHMTAEKTSTPVTVKVSEISCEQTVAEGADITLTLGYKLGSTDSLKWMFNGGIIFHRTPDRIVTGDATDIDEKGNLNQMKVRKKDSGSYTYEVFGNDGKSKSMKAIKLCVLDRVKKPKVEFRCKEPEVIFTCKSDQQPPNTKYEWLEGNTVIGTAKSLTQKVSETKAKKFACRVSNEVSFETSPPVSHNCIKEGCDQTVAEGADITLTLGHKLEPTDSLKWVFGNEVKFYRRGDKIISGKETDIDKEGNLILKKVTKKDSGIYTYQVFGNDGKSKSMKAIKLCVLDRVKNPTAKFKCNEPEVIFICNADQQPPNTNYEWLEGNTVIGTGTSLKKGASETKAKKFACRVSNKASSETSPPVSHNCKTEVFPGVPEELFGISIWVFIGRGGGTILLVIMVVVACCVRTKHKRSSSWRTPKPAQNDDEEQPLPVPQPRKKGPRSQVV